MRIEELILEGFKSYPVRTTITGWDPSFNAITGLNGSGKSNILDAICFVLGITNMSQMRAQNQQDLIYKRGQAGTTKASVTIVFDNSDRATSPVGLENCKQITVTRQIALPNVSKYLLNGHKTQQQNIQTLFQSVQLNINNPNFLIMQGRITKVLNMRPQEILGMVEEAAGTRMFEERKDKAAKTMAKKEKKVSEISSLLSEEITPKLEKLRTEKRAYLAYQKACAELEKIGRVLRAWEWTESNARAARKEEELAQAQQESTTLKKDVKLWGRELEEAEQQKSKIEAKRDKELKKGGRYALLEQKVSELDKELVKMRTQTEIQVGNIGEEEERVRNSEQELEELSKAKAEKQSELDGLEKQHKDLFDSHKQAEDKLSSDEELLQSLLTGLGASGGASGGGYLGQLADARGRLTQAKTEEDQVKNKITMARKELQALEKRWKDVEREAGEGKGNLEKMKRELQALQAKAEKSGWSVEKEEQLEAQLLQARADERRLREERDNVRQRMPNLNFNYQAPYQGFDHSKVKGLVARLVRLDESERNKSTALEITAGGKLYNVVVQDERVGKDLLQHGRLQKRVTILPLSKIDAKRMPAQKVAAAQRLAPGKVRLALELVTYDQNVAAAMSYVFGDTFVCDDAATAQTVTFSPQVGGARSVTLDGDVYDPSGTLSGGAAPQGSGMLLKVQELIEAEERYSEAERKLRRVEEEERGVGEVRRTWKARKDELEIKEHEVKLLAEQVEGSNASRIGADVDRLRAGIQELEMVLQAARDKQAAADQEIKRLEKDMNEFKNNKEGKIDELKASIKKQKTALQKQAVGAKTAQKTVQTAKLEFEQMEKDIAAQEEALDEARASVDVLRKELEVQKRELKKQETKHAEVDQELQREREKLSHFDEELKSIDRRMKEKKQAIIDAEIALQKFEHDVQAIAKERTSAMNNAANLVKQFPWITDESDQFGKAGTDFDFSKYDFGSLRQKAEKLETEQKGMKKKVNPKVMATLESVEKRETALRKMYTTVMKDKEKIEETIQELDRYKLDALQKTWEKVNGDFGAIFAELLPGNFAKLQPPDGQDLTQGLEVKVQLGSVWKQSLTELSGGQRSLIALSLIMSLLQFKPAPMYILDEIDAALDLSHTQHIGQLFRTRFKGSQFIVVSLKEGLFTNANVLFRTKFRDGTSIVERTAQRSTSTLYNSS